MAKTRRRSHCGHKRGHVCTSHCHHDHCRHCSSGCMHRGHKHTARRHRGGGGMGTSSTSAADYMLKTVGAGDVQYNNVFRVGGLGGTSQSNAILDNVTGQRAGGRRRRRGGSFIGNALVPASLLAATYAYHKSRGHRHSKHRRFRGGNNYSVRYPLSPASY